MTVPSSGSMVLSIAGKPTMSSKMPLQIGGDSIFKIHLNPLKIRKPLTGTLANSEEPDEMPVATGNSSGSTLFAKTKLIFREMNTIFGKL